MVGTLALSLFLSWVQVSSDTYIVKSSAGEERARRVLKELEHFHQLIGTLVFRNTELPELPIEVLLIGDEQTMKELEPVYNGRKLAWRAFFRSHAAVQDRDAASAERLFRSGFQFALLQRICEGEHLLRPGMGVHPLHDARRICFAIQEVHRCSDKGRRQFARVSGRERTDPGERFQ